MPAVVSAPNFALNATTANNAFSAVWKASRCMKKSGWKCKASSDGTTKDTSGVAANDKWGGNADPMLDTYPTALDAVAAWNVFEGPQVHQLAIAVAPGALFRGEAVSQATSLATGELVGVVFDTGAATGWAVILPRTGVFNGSDVITGAASGATFTPTSIKTLSIEVVLWKNTTVGNGSFYYVCADVAAEAAQLFSALAAKSGCTATIAPGGDNAAAGVNASNFPALGIVGRGVAAVAGGAAATHDSWFGQTANFGNANGVAFNATPSAGVSSDGTWWVEVSNSSVANTCTVFGCYRVDDTEPGDPSLWVIKTNSNNAPGAWVRTTGSGTFNQVYDNPTNFFGSTVNWRGYCARGAGGAKDIPVYLLPEVAQQNGQNSSANVQNAADVMRVANYPTAAASAPLVQEPVRLFCDKTASKIQKGRVRQLASFPIGAGFDNVDTNQWMVFVPQVANSTPAIATRYDGVATPAP